MRSFLAALLLLPCAADAARAAALEFLRGGKQEKSIELGALQAACRPETVTVDDPYYGRTKSFIACKLADVIRIGFDEPVGALRGETVFFRALDGYAKPVDGALLTEPGAYLAFADAERVRAGEPGWEPIEYKQADPGPLYLVWTAAHQRDTHRYPWPYQLAAIDIESIERLYPHVAPRSAAKDSPAWTGYAVFTGECIACHSINGEGGRIGPELNVPRSIVEYRPADQIKDYVRDPAAFRYTSMPAHPHLSEPQLDGLIAYFSTMQTLKHDPHRTP